MGEWFVARMIEVHDDLGTEYLTAPQGMGGSDRQATGSFRFAPAPPESARELRLVVSGLDDEWHHYPGAAEELGLRREFGRGPEEPVVIVLPLAPL
jgi:hypothetical protein